MNSGSDSKSKTNYHQVWTITNELLSNDLSTNR